MHPNSNTIYLHLRGYGIPTQATTQGYARTQASQPSIDALYQAPISAAYPHGQSVPPQQQY